jgi:glycerol-1-phosphate dehydrogenase [NAD(P)+]
LRRDLDRLDIAAAVAAWPSPKQVEARIEALLGSGQLAEKAMEETRAKALSPDALRTQLTRLRDGWPVLRARLETHLEPFRDARAMLRTAGCPCEPEQIGITRDRLRQSFEQAYYIRRRFTVLDFAIRLGVFGSALKELFGPGGAWPMEGGRS